MTRSKSTRKGTYQTTTHVAVALLLLILFVSVAYFFFIPSPDLASSRDSRLAELATKRDVWENQRPLSYRYAIRRSCDCVSEHLQPYIATERRSQRTAAFNTPVESSSGTFLTAPPNPAWIDDIFAFAEQALLSDNTVEIAFHATYGFPTLVDIRRNRRADDADNRYEIQDFEVIEYR